MIGEMRLGAGRCPTARGHTPAYEDALAGFVAVIWLTTVVGAWLGGDLRGWVVVVGYVTVVAGTLPAIAIIAMVVRAYRR